MPRFERFESINRRDEEREDSEKSVSELIDELNSLGKFEGERAKKILNQVHARYIEGGSKEWDPAIKTIVKRAH